jgi:hypothetical protein
VHALAVGGVLLHRLHPQRVPPGQAGQHDPALGGGAERHAVQRRGDHVGGAVDEGPGARLAAGERDRGDTPHRRAGGQVGEVDRDVVPVDGEQRGAPLGLGLGQTARVAHVPSSM